MIVNRIRQLEEFLKEEPNDAFLQYALALEYIKAGNYANAKNIFSKLVDNHPDYLPAFYQYGKLMEQTGDKINSIEIYRKGMELAKQKNNLKTLKELEEAITSANEIKED